MTLAGGTRLVAMIAMLAACQDHACARPIELADYPGWVTAGSPKVSPDATQVVYTRTTVDAMSDRRSSELRIMRIDGKGDRALGRGWSASWSPDGRRVAYVSSVDGRTELLLRDVIDGDVGDPYPATQEAVSPQSPTWSPDGSKIAFAAMVDHPTRWEVPLPEQPEGAEWVGGPVIVDSLHFRSGSGSITSYRRHLFVLDVETGSVQQVTSGDWYVGARYAGIFFGGAFDWTADSRSIVFDGDMDLEDTIETMDRSNLYRVDIETGHTDRLTDRPGFWRTPSVSPDGRYVAFTGYGKSDDTFAPRQLKLLDLDDGSIETLLADLPDEVYRLHWKADSSGMYVTQDRHGSTNVEWVGIDGAWRAVTRGSHRLYLGNIGQDGTAVASVTSPTADYNVARVDLGSGRIARLTAANQSLLDEIDLGRVEEFWYEAPDGQEIQAWLFYPPGFDPDSRYPLILEIHGGPHYMAGTDFSFRLHEFAARGYLVLMPNVRGSTGYGSDFANAIDDAFPGDTDYADLIAGVDHVVGRGLVDETRMYLMGCSGGGSLAAWVTSRTDRFAAAAVSCAVTNHISQAGTADVVGWGYTRFDKPFWEYPAPWLAHSPIMQVGTVETPTLVMVGENDGRTPVTQSAEYYVALRAKGVDTKLLIFEGEGHGPWRSRPSNLFRTQEYIDAWFRRYRRSDRATP